jgi:hypothetical protein
VVLAAQSLAIKIAEKTSEATMISFKQFVLEGKKKDSVQDFLSAAAKVARQQRLERERMVGKPHSATYGGRPTPEQDRRSSRRELRDF